MISLKEILRSMGGDIIDKKNKGTSLTKVRNLIITLAIALSLVTSCQDSVPEEKEERVIYVKFEFVDDSTGDDIPVEKPKDRPKIAAFKVKLLAGSFADNVPSDYSTPATLSDSRFNNLRHLGLDGGNIYSSEFDGRIKKIDTVNDKVSLFAGTSLVGDVFTNQASESLSNLNLPKLHGLVVNGDFIYAAALDHSIIKLPKTANHDQQITKLDSLFVGSGSSSEAGKVDLSSANFPVSFGDILPADIKLNYVTKLLASKNYLYAYDFLNHSIRKISLNL
nr:hypothetical protein [SAR324 cluster bacterium]